MPQNITPVSIQIEVGVICKVDHRVLICNRPVLNDQGIVLTELINHLHLQCTRVSLLSGRACTPENKFSFFHAAGKHFKRIAPVQMIFPVVFRKVILFPVKRKRGVFYAVGIAADKSADIAASGLIAVYVVITQYYISQDSLFVRNQNALYRAAIIQDPYRHTGSILHRIPCYCLSAFRLAKPLLIYFDHTAYLHG